VIVGFGTIGRSVAKLLAEKREELLKGYGLRPDIVAIVDSKGAAIDEKGLDTDEVLKRKASKGTVASGGDDLTAAEVTEQLEAEVLIEATPTNYKTGEPGLSNIRNGMRRKMNVVTVNKGPLALALPSLLELAHHNGVQIRFSGSVGGGIPILDLAKKCILGNRINSVKAILNGTTNYILTRMSEAKIPMNIALREAQEAGYAETDPTHDINGTDTAAKLSIIANWVMDMNVSINDVKTRGITEITISHVDEALKNNSYIKLVGSIANGELRVEPRPIPRNHPLCVNGTLNAVVFETELSREITLVGHGAGGVETASAVLRDLIDIRSSLHNRSVV